MCRLGQHNLYIVNNLTRFGPGSEGKNFRSGLLFSLWKSIYQLLSFLVGRYLEPFDTGSQLRLFVGRADHQEMLTSNSAPWKMWRRHWSSITGTWARDISKVGWILILPDTSFKLCLAKNKVPVHFFYFWQTHILFSVINIIKQPYISLFCTSSWRSAWHIGIRSDLKI